VPDVATQRTPFAKRAMDLIIGVPALLLLSPLLAWIGWRVRSDVGPPALFRQQRLGLGAKPFRLAKFRTMTDHRDARGQLAPDEARLTQFGSWLRATSLDELPELMNVVRGEMSLVGPRPLLPRYLSRYSTRQARRHDVMPGITGWAQVNGRNAITWEQKFEFDVWYVDHWSVGLDLKILLLTLVQVAQGKNITAEGHATMPEFLGSEGES
jgi:sugar transferase EpsL